VSIEMKPVVNTMHVSLPYVIIDSFEVCKNNACVRIYVCV